MRVGTIVLISLLLASCGTSTDRDSLNGELAGEVFVVTRGGQNIKLGLVTVVAISEVAMSGFLVQKRQFAARERADLEARLQEALHAEAEARMALAAAAKETGAAKDIWEPTYKESLYRRPGRDEQADREVSRLHDRLVAAQGKERGRNRELTNRRDELAELRAGKEYFDSSEFYFTDLPIGVASAKTNADGLFSIALPRYGRFALAARASRTVMSVTENYYWLVWVSLDGAEKQKILLANDNLTTAASPHSVLTLLQ